ncbi:MAG: type II secretion system protein [Planctomycetes bacterium]|nr:type II secretion system protein [Planctomycetota bacterium]
MRRKGFTLIDLLFVAAVVVILAMIILPLLGRSRGHPRWISCQSNLSSIAKALKLYGGEFNDSYPWICSDSDTSCPYNFRSNMQNLVPEANFYSLLDSGSGTNHQNICENLNLLTFHKKMVSYKAFLCPGSSANLYQDRGDNYGFLTTGTPKVQCEYGYHAGWKYTAANGVKNPAPLDANLPGDFVIMADMNSGKDTPFVDLNGPGWNHGKVKSIFILKANASVALSTTVNCDLNNHSIYMAGTTAASDATSATPSAPLDKNDSVLYVSGQ